MDCKACNSFAQWGIDNVCEDFLEKYWDWDKNTVNPWDVQKGSYSKYYFYCDDNGCESKLKNIHSIVNIKDEIKKCEKCNSFAQHLEDLYGDNALQKYWDYDKNINIDPWEINYNNTSIKIFIKCQEHSYHESYETRCTTFIRGIRCPCCSNNKVHPLDSIGSIFPEILNIWSDINIKTPFEFKPKSGKKVWFKCESGVHEDYERSLHTSQKCNFRCPRCMEEQEESSLQEKTRIYLIELGYAVLHELFCNIVVRNPKTNGILRFDNEVEELKLIIEVHGEQHYKPVGWHIGNAKKNNTTPEQELHYLQLKDRYKRIYSKKQGYYYLEIPYTAFDKKNTYKKLINNTVAEILKLNING
jgi:hypothetical protein